MSTLILSPIVAAVLVAGGKPQAHVTPAPDTVTGVRFAVRIAPFAIAESLREQTPPPATPTPVPTPKATPRPAPRPVVPPAAPGSVVAIIQAAAARWGVSGDWMVSIARCESGLRPNAYNPRGPYIGLFQFLQSTFTANGGTNIWDAADQANIAAKMLAHGQAHQWSCA